MEANPGEVTPRKGPSAILVIVVVIVVVAIIGGVTLFTGGKGSEGNTNPNPVLPTTITQLKSKVDSLNSTVIGFSGRLSKVEQTVAGISAPTVTKAEFDGLQTAVNDLADSVANWSEANISGGLDYWLEEDDGDIRLHVVSPRDMLFMAEITILYDELIPLSGDTYGAALSSFYKDSESWGDRDYRPTLISTGSGWAIEWGDVLLENITGLNENTNKTITITLDEPISIPYVADITTNLTWEYAAVTFYTSVEDVTAGEGFSERIKYLPKNYDEDDDRVSVRLLPLPETNRAGGSNGGM